MRGFIWNFRLVWIVLAVGFLIAGCWQWWVTGPGWPSVRMNMVSILFSLLVAFSASGEGDG